MRTVGPAFHGKNRGRINRSMSGKSVARRLFRIAFHLQTLSDLVRFGEELPKEKGRARYAAHVRLKKNGSLQEGPSPSCKLKDTC